MKLPEIWEASVDDSCPPPEEVDVADAIDNLVFLAVESDGEVVGVFVSTLPDSSGSIEAHTMMTKKCRGRMAIEAGKKAIEWFFSNLGCKRIQSWCFSDAPNVIFFAKHCGFSFLRNRDRPVSRKGKQVEILEFYLDKPVNP